MYLFYELFFMKIDQIYTEREISNFGLTPREIMNVSYKVFEKEQKIYFFEELQRDEFRLYSVIGERSFFLN